MAWESPIFRNFLSKKANLLTICQHGWGGLRFRKFVLLLSNYFDKFTASSSHSSFLVSREPGKALLSFRRGLVVLLCVAMLVFSESSKGSLNCFDCRVFIQARGVIQSRNSRSELAPLGIPHNSVGIYERLNL